ncbi:hypothetical protein PspS04_04705 [Pseudomonas sp. S04]|nr:hypothetical protein PspS04_04705 [Pseudomonas sp. S04]QHF32192.1 hypothetical protein PspS19_04705 [Pseudomonas sp. S19]
MSEYGHAEPKRGTEWWGKSVLLTFALFKSEPPSGGTIGGHYRKNGYVLCLIQYPRGRHANKLPRHRPLQRCVDTYANRGQALLPQKEGRQGADGL